MNGQAMTNFTIDSENNITALSDVPEGAVPNDSFSSQAELAKITAEWPMCRIIDAWNSFAGCAPFDELKPVKKFTNREAAVTRIWRAIQRLGANVAPQAATGAPKRGKASKPATRGTRRDTARKSAARTKKPSREGSKKAEVLDLMRRAKGATLVEIMKLTGWQAHTVRGFVSGTLVKKLGLKIESFRKDEKERSYRIT
jgi:hypothetical protein